jgi:hypothetical protein
MVIWPRDAKKARIANPRQRVKSSIFTAIAIMLIPLSLLGQKQTEIPIVSLEDSGLLKMIEVHLSNCKNSPNQDTSFIVISIEPVIFGLDSSLLDSLYNNNSFPGF